MIFVIPNKDLSAKNLAVLRTLCERSIAEIKQASELRQPIAAIEPFARGWDADKLYLVKLGELMVGRAPVPFEVCEGESAEEVERLSSEALRTLLVELRGIELEQQRQSDLEMGYIASPEAFEPHDEDWL